MWCEAIPGATCSQRLIGLAGAVWERQLSDFVQDSCSHNEKYSGPTEQRTALGLLSVLRILGIRLGIALMHLAQLLIGQWQFFCRIAQHHQPADDGAEGYDEYQPGIPGHCRSP